MASRQSGGESCFMSDESARAAQLADDLRIELARIRIPMRTSEHDALHGVVRNYVGELRSLEWPPEQVIKTVKQIANDVGITPSARHDVLPSAWTETDKLLFDLVSWSIAEYYDGRDGR